MASTRGFEASTLAFSLPTAPPLASATFTVLNAGSRSSLKVRRSVSGGVSTVLPAAGTALSSLPCANAAAGNNPIATAAARPISCLRVNVFMLLRILDSRSGGYERLQLPYEHLLFLEPGHGQRPVYLFGSQINPFARP